jgi:4-amino-4-deoxy-L-arabinose transferase-like glycosyltransferase
VIALAGWALVAVAARLAVSWASGEAGVFADMTQYHERAVHLVTTGTLMPDALRGPGYPLLLAAAYWLGGVSFWSARVANALVGGVLTLATGWLARRAGAGEHAWIAAAIVAVYPALVLSSVYLMPDSLYATLAMLALLLVRHRSAVMGAAGGVVAGLAILTRSVGVALLAVPVVLALWTMAARAAAPRAALARLAAFVVACVVVLAPWLAFTSRVAGGPLLDTTSGMNVLLGNHDGATGRLSMSDDAPLRQAYVTGARSEADASARALRAGLAWAASHPGAWLRLAAAKVGYLFGLEGREHAWVYGQGYFGARATWVVTAWGVALLAAFPCLVVAALAGVVRAGGAVAPVHVALAAFVVATAALHVVSFAESRFHLPLVPVLAVAASLGAPLRRPTAAAATTAATAASAATTGATTATNAATAAAAAAPTAATTAATTAARGRADVSRARLAGAAVVLALLGAAWAGQAPELVGALSRLRAPGGATSAPPY